MEDLKKCFLEIYRLIDTLLREECFFSHKPPYGNNEWLLKVSNNFIIWNVSSSVYHPLRNKFNKGFFLISKNANSISPVSNELDRKIIVLKKVSDPRFSNFEEKYLLKNLETDNDRFFIFLNKGGHFSDSISSFLFGGYLVPQKSFSRSLHGTVKLEYLLNTMRMNPIPVNEANLIIIILLHLLSTGQKRHLVVPVVLLVEDISLESFRWNSSFNNFQKKTVDNQVLINLGFTESSKDSVGDNICNEFQEKQALPMVGKNLNQDSVIKQSREGICFNHFARSKTRFLCLYGEPNRTLNCSSIFSPIVTPNSEEPTREIGIESNRARKFPDVQYKIIKIEIPLFPPHRFREIRQERESRNYPSLSFGEFMYNFLPESYLHTNKSNKEVSDISSPATKPFQILMSKMERTVSITGKPRITARIDLFPRPKHDSSAISNNAVETEKTLFRSLISRFDSIAMRGPLISVHISWTVKDLWETFMYPELPSIPRNTGEVETHVAFTPGCKGDSFLNPLWKEICLLRIIQDTIRGFKNQDNEILSEAVKYSPEVSSLCDLTNISKLDIEENGSPFIKNNSKDNTDNSSSFLNSSLNSIYGNNYHIEPSNFLEQTKVFLIHKLNPEQEPTTPQKILKNTNQKVTLLNDGSTWLKKYDDFCDDVWCHLSMASTILDIHQSMQCILDYLFSSFTSQALDPRKKKKSFQLPLLSENNHTQLANFIIEGIKLSQSLTYKTISKETDALKNNIDSYNSLRETYKSLARSLYMVNEIGVRATVITCTNIIREIDSTISTNDLEFFTSIDKYMLSDTVFFSRLNGLLKITELASLTRRVLLPLESTRSLLRHALQIFRDNYSNEADEATNPFFVIALPPNVSKLFLDKWVNLEPYTMLRIDIGEAFSAVFSLINGEVESQYVHENFDIFPKVGGKWCEDKDSLRENYRKSSSHPIYLWKSHFVPGKDLKGSGASQFLAYQAETLREYSLILFYERHAW